MRWIFLPMVATAAMGVPLVPASAGKILKTLSDPIALYNSDGTEAARIKARDFPAGADASEKGLSWLVVDIRGQTYQVRRGDVVYESAATACVASRSLNSASDVGTAGSRAGTNAGAGAGGTPCIPQRR